MFVSRTTLCHYLYLYWVHTLSCPLRYSRCLICVPSLSCYLRCCYDLCTTKVYHMPPYWSFVQDQGHLVQEYQYCCFLVTFFLTCIRYLFGHIVPYVFELPCDNGVLSNVCFYFAIWAELLQYSSTVGPSCPWIYKICTLLPIFFTLLLLYACSL